MKKLLIIATVLCSVLSCTKDELNNLEEKQPITFTAAIDNGGDTKTEVSTDGKVAWVVGDEVSVSNGTETKVYYVSAVGDNRKATLTIKSGTGFSGEGTYTATYGNVNDQWYDATHSGSNCPMTATATTVEGSGAFMFKNSCGVVAVKANTGDIAIAKIMLGNTALNFATPKKLNGTYLVAVPGGESFTTVSFVKADGSKATKNGSASVKLNEIKEMDTKSYFNDASKYSGFEPIALPGVFTIDNLGNKVQFASGNLWKDSSGNYHLEDNQYIGVTTYSTEHLAYFDPRTSIWDVPSSISGLGWRTMQSDELTYIVNNARGITDYAGTQAANILTYCCCRVTENDTDKYVGMLMFPDNFIWNTTTMGAKPSSRHGNNDNDVHQLSVSQFEHLCAAGVVFFPKTGYYWGGTVYQNARGQYLFGTIGSNKGSRNFQYAQWNAIDMSNYNAAVRLVRVK